MVNPFIYWLLRKRWYLHRVINKTVLFFWFLHRTQGDAVVCESRNDAQGFAEINSAMKVLMFSDSEVWEIMKLLTAILNLGNLKFKSKIVGEFSSNVTYLEISMVVIF